MKKIITPSEKAYTSNVIRIKLKPETRGIKSFSVSALSADIESISQVFEQSLFTKTSSTTSKKNFNKHQKYGLDLWFEVKIKEGADTISVLKEFEKLPEVEKAELSYKIKLYSHINKSSSFPNDTMYGLMWHLKLINVEKAWEITTGNPLVKVGLIDQGIQLDHPDIQSNIGGYESFVPGKPFKGDRHGSHTGGTIAAITNNQTGIAGIAGGDGSPNSGIKIYSLQVFHDKTAGGFANAIIWAADNGMAIISNSWGYTTPGVYEQVVLDAIDYFCEYGGGDVLHGGLAIFAAGNYDSELPYYPAAYEKCLSVAATNDKDRKAFYSNFGETVDISAPGGEMNLLPTLGVLSLGEDYNYNYLQGTSMACPHTSGSAALVVSEFPGKFSAEQLKEILKLSADNIDNSNAEYIGKLGSGRLNAGNAMELAQIYSGVPQLEILNLEIQEKDIKISWNNNDLIILAVNTEPFFGRPNLEMKEGDTINGNDLILYKGNLGEFIHENPTPGIKYYYRAWLIQDGEIGAGSKVVNATSKSTDLPYIKLNLNDQLDGWEKNGRTIISPIMDLSNYNEVNIVYRNYATGPAWLKNLRISRNGGETWNIIASPTVVNRWNYISLSVKNLTDKIRFMWFISDDPDTNPGTWEITDFGVFDTVGNTLELINGALGNINFQGIFKVRSGAMIPLKTISEGKRFSGWLFNQKPYDFPNRIFTVNQNTVAKASFERKKLTLSRLGKGIMSMDPGTYYFNKNESITLTAENIEGQNDTFFGWMVGSTLIKTNSVTVRMNNDIVVQAQFKHKIKIFTQIVGNGQILYPESGIEIFNDETIQILAEASVGSTFVEWEKWVDGDLSEPSNKLQDSIKITAINTVKFVAKFTDVPLEEKSVTMRVNGLGNVSPKVGQSLFQVGKTFKAVAVPASGYIFTHWDSPEYGRLETQIVYLLPNKNFTLTANFGLKPPPITDPVWLSMVRIGKGKTVPKGSTRIVQRGSTFTYLAIPDEGWKFSRWESNLFEPHYEPEVTFTVTEGSTVGSFFERTEDSASLDIMINGEGMTDPSIGKHMYAKGDEIFINATPAEGWEFEKWTSPYLGTFNTPSLNFIIQSDTRFTAHFKEKSVEPETFTLNLTKEGNGNTSPASGIHTYEKGEQIELIASPERGWLFKKWYSPELGEFTDPVIEILMNSNITISAIFSEITYQLSINSSGNGSINWPNGMYELKEGETVELIAFPFDGFKFVKWISPQLGDIFNSSTELSMNQNIDITAIFEEIPKYNLFISKIGEGTITPVEGNYQYKEGDSVILKAIPKEGWIFTHWKINDEIIDTDIVLLNIENDIYAEAIFQNIIVSYTVEISKSGNGSIVPREGVYQVVKNAEFIIKAIPDTGWAFKHWKVNNETIETNDLILRINDNTIIIAIFDEIKPVNVKFNNSQITIDNISYVLNGELTLSMIF